MMDVGDRPQAACVQGFPDHRLMLAQAGPCLVQSITARLIANIKLMRRVAVL